MIREAQDRRELVGGVEEPVGVVHGAVPIAGWDRVFF